MIRRHVVILLAALCSAGASGLWVRAMAQGIDMSSGGPVEVTSRDGFEWQQNQQKVIATGDARAVRGDVTVIADRLTALYRKKAGAAQQAATAAKPDDPTGPDTGDNEVYRLEADGHVHIYTPTDLAVGDHAVYDIDQALLVMTGKAMKLTTPQDVMTARDSMEYWSAQHMAVGRGNAVVVTTDGRRLSGDVLVGYTTPAATPAGGATPAKAAPAKPAPDAAGKPPVDPIAASGKLQRVEAFGNVEVRTAVDTVRGDRGVYVPDTGMARLVGHVRITHGENQLNGPAADINMKTGIAHLIAAPGGRVEGLIMPNDAASATTPGVDAPAGAKKTPAPGGAKPATPAKKPTGASSP
ncbi:MAG TPA: LptA/OstA family protein [Acetobacteraceae bacterium]|jgi:lipopolysaccharide export system protein LptA